MSDLPPVCLETLEEITDGDTNFLGELWRQFREDARERLPELRLALGRADGAKVRDLAHSLAGSANCIAADPLRRKALALETCVKEHNFSSALPLLEAVEVELRRVEEFFAGVAE